VLFSGMAGALSLARAAVDVKLQEDMLKASREFYIKAFCD